MRDEGSYAAAWRRYRWWSRAFWLLFLLYIPALAIVGRELGWTRGNGTPILFAAIAWMIAVAVIGAQKFNLRCPRCGELFFYKFDDRPWRMSWRHNPFARRCMHCGLPKWAATDPRP